MTRRAFARLVNRELRRWPALHGWRWAVTALPREYAVCYPDDRLIVFDDAHIREDGAREIADTVLHEIAHALTGRTDHDHLWGLIYTALVAELLP